MNLRCLTLGLWLTAVASTPIRDLSTDSLTESNCEWPNLDIDDELDGVMVLYKGRKLAEWRDPASQEQDWWGTNWKDGTTQHALFSVTKTWISVLIGMLYRDGFLDWNTQHPDMITLGDIFPDEGVWDEVWDIQYLFHGGSKVPELKAITLGELMSMRTGYSETVLSSPLDSSLVQDLDGLVAWWHPLFRSGLIESQSCFKCGNYLSSSGIVNYVIKEKTKTASNPDGWGPLEYARQTSATLPNGNVGLFEALGMEQGSYSWDVDPEGVARSAYGLWVDLEDMAKFGQLLLQGGKVVYNGMEKEIIPVTYLEEMTMTQSRMSGSLLPYGWQVWNWGADDDGDSGFCAEGLGYQSICVFPKQEMVVAIQASLSWGLEAFFSNIGIRNSAIKTIRDGVVCPSTPAPTQPIFIPPPPTSAPVNNPVPTQPIFTPPAPTTSPVNDGENTIEDGTDGDTIDGMNDEKDKSKSESELLFGKDMEGTNVPLGLIITLVVVFIIIALLCAMLCFARRKKDKKSEADPKAMAMAVDAKYFPDSAYEIYDVDLSDDVSKGSVDTEDSDEDVTAYAVEEDMEQQSSGSSYYL